MAVVSHFMRLAATIISIVVLSLSSAFRPLINPVNINGHLKKHPKDTSAVIAYLRVFVKGNNKILAESLTDGKGNFELTFTPEKEKSFDFYCVQPELDTMLIASVTGFESDTPEMNFFLPSQPKRNALGKAICPKCKRTDKVYEIEYGDPIVSSLRIGKSGDTTFSPIYKGKYRTGCLSGSAKYYCDRDKVKF
jgi:hypothetical protein